MGQLFALISALGYGLNDVFVALGMKRGKATSSQALIINLMAGVIVLLAVSLWIYCTSGFPPLHWLGIVYFIASGISAPFLGRICGISAIQHIGPSRSSTLRLTDTFFTMFIAVTFLNDSLDWRSALGIILLALGVIMVIQENRKREAEAPVAATEEDSEEKSLKGFMAVLKTINPGIFLGLASAFFFALGGIFRQLGVQYIPSPLLGTTLSTCVAFLTNGLTAYLNGELQGSWDLTPLSALYFALAGLASTAGMLAFFGSLTAGTSISITAALKNLSPLVTMFLSWIFLRQFERITLRLILCLFIVMAGAYLIVS